MTGYMLSEVLNTAQSICIGLVTDDDDGKARLRHWGGPMPKGHAVPPLDLGAGAEAAKAQPKNIRAEASRISVEPKLQNV